MQRLRAPESGGLVGGEVSPEDKDEGEGGAGGESRGSTSHEVIVESVPRGEDERGAGGANEVGKKSAGIIPINTLVGVVPPASTAEPLAQQSPAPASLDASMGGARKGVRDEARKMPATSATAALGPDMAMQEKRQAPPTVDIEPTKRADSRTTKVIIVEQQVSSRGEERSKSSTEMAGPHRAAAALSPDAATAPSGEQDRPTLQVGEKERRLMATSSWCQTQLPEAVAEKSLGVRLGGPGELSAGGDRSGDAGLITKRSPDLGLPRLTETDLGYGASGSPSLRRMGTVSAQEQREHGASVGTGHYSYSASGGTVFGGLGPGAGVGIGSVGDWQMDSVIEQIEKQMAAVLEKIEGDMPSLLEQISDCPEQRPKSAHSSPLAYTQPVPSQEERDSQRVVARSGQSARGGVEGRGL
ncbi:hypothetical protein GJAV_G00175690 [Gymnothorax javanicus]|nr:hypothetical protein GJAV_G00175690 [Gymnothorax javanicus]